MSWKALDAELDQWGSTGAATLWWRDDDAKSRTVSLERLLALSREWDIPATLAVVPEPAGEDLMTAVSGAPVRVLQHGCRHVNRAAPGAKKNEMIADLSVQQDLAAGLTRLRELFEERLLPVLVPPWNRIDEPLLPLLADLGFRGLSRYKPRRSESNHGLLEVNAHVDIIDWRSSGGFLGEQQSLDALVAHLRGRRLSEVDAAEPTGLLTHHLDHDEGCWNFIDRLFAKTREHPAVRWLDAGEIFTI